jgi:hypothetical protein
MIEPQLQRIFKVPLSSGFAVQPCRTGTERFSTIGVDRSRQMKREEDAWRKAIHEGPEVMDRCTFTTTTAVDMACEEIGLHPGLVK